MESTDTNRNEIIYKYDDLVSVEELFSLLEKMMNFAGDRFPSRNVFHVALRSREKEAVSLKNVISVTARRTDGFLVGYLRLLTDHAYIHYILDVMVDPEIRSRSVGSRLVQLAVNNSKEEGFIKIFLTAMPGTEAFYEKFGFKEGMSPVLTLRGEDFPSGAAL